MKIGTLFGENIFVAKFTPSFQDLHSHAVTINRQTRTEVECVAVLSFQERPAPEKGFIYGRTRPTLFPQLPKSMLKIDLSSRNRVGLTLNLNLNRISPGFFFFLLHF